MRAVRAIAVTIGFALAFTACGDAEESPTDDVATPAQEGSATSPDACLRSFTDTAPRQLAGFAEFQHTEGVPVVIGVYDGPTAETDVLAPRANGPATINPGACVVAEDRKDGERLRYLFVESDGGWLLPNDQSKTSFARTLNLDSQLSESANFDIADLQP